MGWDGGYAPPMSTTLLCLLLACRPPVADDPEGDSGDPAASGGVEHIGDADDPTDALYSLERVIPVDITLSADALASLNVDPYTWVQGDVTVDGTLLQDVGVHLKGRLGSFRDLSGKAAFRVDFNQYQDQRYLGLEGLTLNNLLDDYSMVHEITAYPFYDVLGIAAPRVGYAWVTLNGQDYGLYANVETPDDHWLRRVYDQPDGNLYEATYIWHDDDSYTLVDFDYDTYTGFDLDEGQDVAWADILALVDAVQGAAGTEAFYGDVGAVLDWEHFFRFLATEIWVGQWDGYNFNSNNYSVYFNPQTGLAELLPWGHDWCFMDWSTWTSPWTLLGSNCLAQADCKADFKTSLRGVLDEADAWPFQERVEQAVQLIEPWMLVDPRREQDVGTIYASQEDMLDWVRDRTGEVAVMFGVLDPEISVAEVSAGQVSALQGEGDLALSAPLVAAFNYGGDDVTIGDVPFQGVAEPYSAFSGNLPDFDDDPATWTGLEAAAYTCLYASSDEDLAFSIPVTPGVPVTLQVLFFEVYYSGQGHRKVHILVEGEQVVTDLDTHSLTDTAGVLYSLELTPEDASLDVMVRGSSQGDGLPIANALLVVQR